MNHALIALGYLLFFVTNAPAAGREFASGYIGTLPPSAEDRARTWFRRPEVRRLLAALERGPLPVRKAQSLLAGTATGVAGLERMGLVAESAGQLHIDFPYFTARDVERIHAVAAKYVPGLVAAYRVREPDLDALLARYPVATVSRKRLAFVLLAGFSLNLDALDLLTERGYRQPLLIKGPGWQYGFWAAEVDPHYSYKGYYWGSSSFPAGDDNLTPPVDYTFSSFGDPDSDPRMNFPDLFALTPDRMTPSVREAAERLGLHDDPKHDLKNVIGLDRVRDIGTILFAMHEGARSESEICHALPPGNDSTCKNELALLVAADYAERDNAGYELTAPVLDRSDKAMMDAVLALSRNILERWLAQNYTPMRADLAGLTALRQGVPYPALFSQIWHELFGYATRELTSEGVIENPRDPRSPLNGSVPALWRVELFHHRWE